MSKTDTSPKTDAGRAKSEAPRARDEIADENKSAVAASRTAPEPAAPDGARDAGPTPPSGRKGREEIVHLGPERNEPAMGYYRRSGFVALAIAVVLLLVAIFLV